MILGMHIALGGNSFNSRVYTLSKSMLDILLLIISILLSNLHDSPKKLVLKVRHLKHRAGKQVPQDLTVRKL